MLHSVQLAKWLMRKFPGNPDPNDTGLGEIFSHPQFVKADAKTRKAIMLESFRHRYDEETRKPFFKLYFHGYDYSRHLTGKRVLDFGCFTGGRGVRWAEMYGI